ncbi:MAG TPA: efflux RND transporter permease subunit [Candidatus Baltobacteraceae bacterium]
MWLTRFALTRPVITAMVFGALTLFGVFAYFQIGKSQDPPGTTFPVVVIQAGYPGAAPQDVEKLIIKPIEDQMVGIDGLDQISATAQEGIGVVVVQFKLDTNLDLAAIDVQRRVDTARVFMPSDLDPPYVEKNSNTQPIIDLAVNSKTLSPAALNDIVTNRVKPLIEQIPNVQSVDVGGGLQREFHVQPDPATLLALNATLGDVFGAISQNNANLPGGRMLQPSQEASVAVHADVQSAADLAAVPLSIPGASSRLLTVGNVAKTDDGYAEQRNISHFNGKPRLYISINKTLESDEINATKIARERLKGIEAQFPQISFFEVDAPADDTAAELNGVWQSLFEGILLTAIVMLLFLHAWRNAAVVLISIPVSIFATFVVMKALGFTFDFMSLMGLSLIIGILVDDSIVVLENITRHRDMGESPMDAAINGRTEIGGAAIAITMVDVVVFLPIAFLPGIVGKYLKEFALVVVVATMFSLLVSFTLTPLLAGRWSILKRSTAPPEWFYSLRNPLVNGIIGLVGLLLSIFGPGAIGVLGIIMIAVVVLNLVVQNYDKVVTWYKDVALPSALDHGWFVAFVCGTLFMNSLFLIFGGVAGAGGMVAAVYDVVVLAVLGLGLLVGLVTRGGVRSGRLKGRDPFSFLARSAAGMFDRVWLTVATIALPLVLVGATIVLGGVSFDFVPGSQTGAMRMTLTYPSGTPIAVTAKSVDRLENAIMKIDGIDTVSSRVGSKPTGHGQSTGGNYASISAQTLPNRRGDTNKIIERIRALKPLAPGGDFQVSGEGGGAGGTPIFYSITGPDDQLDIAAQKIVAFLKDTPGTVNVQSSAETGAPRLNVRIDPARAAILGVSTGAAATAARIAVDGAVATKVRTSTGLVDVRVQFPADRRSTVDSLKAVRVRANDATMVPLGSVASFSWAVAPTKVERQDRQRVVNVTGGMLPGFTLGSVTGPLESKLGQIGFLPPGVHLSAQGNTQFMQEAMISMLLALLTSFMLVYMLMVVLYGSFLEPFIVMFSIPVALVGAIFALVIMHLIDPEGTQSLNIISMIGIIMLFGLVSKNGILVVDYSNTLVKRGMRVKEAVLQASATRFRPILMTTFAMVFGMLPLALGRAEGAEWRQAIGTVIIGGLISSLILTLFLVPMIYNTWIGWIEARKDRKAVREEMSPVGPPVPV